MNDFESDFIEPFRRHVDRLGFVPPEFRREGRFMDDDLPSYPAIRRTPTTNAGMRTVMSMEEWWAIENAAILAHRTHTGNSSIAEFAREGGGYSGLGDENFFIPDQRPLIQGGDNDPLD